MSCALLVSGVILYVVGFFSVGFYLDDHSEFGDGEIFCGAVIWPYTAYQGDFLRILLKNLKGRWEKMRQNCKEFLRKLTEL